MLILSDLQSCKMQVLNGPNLKKKIHVHYVVYASFIFQANHHPLQHARPLRLKSNLRIDRVLSEKSFEAKYFPAARLEISDNVG
jgi:hypothetical protein